MSTSALKELFDALHYFHVSELKALCIKLKLPVNGKKSEIIQRIHNFLKDGTLLQIPSIPEVSKAKNPKSKMTPSTLILLGNYKNDAVTRVFMKSLVGDHFHFTAFGQDWIRSRWLEGNPPTYLEFAAFWKKEYLARKKRKASPKQEWAYLSFIQKYGEKHPNATRDDIAKAWEQERKKQKKKALEIIKTL